MRYAEELRLRRSPGYDTLAPWRIQPVSPVAFFDSRWLPQGISCEQSIGITQKSEQDRSERIMLAVGIYALMAEVGDLGPSGRCLLLF